MKKLIGTLLIFFLGSGLYGQEKKVSFSLDEAIQYALKNSYSAKISVNDVKAAEKKVWETTTIGLPQINAKVDYQNWLKQQVSLLPAEIFGGAPGTFSEVTFGTKQNLNASITLTQLLFDGSYLVGLQSAKTYLQISKQAQEKTELGIREAVINAYGNVLVAEKTIDILLKNKTVNNRILKGARIGYENGLTEQEQVEQFEITEGTIKSSLQSAKRLRDIAYKLLNISLGIETNLRLILTDDLDSLVLANTNLNLVTNAFKFEDHIDYRIAKNDRESKRLLMKLEQSKALPKLSAFVNYGSAANSNTFSFFENNQQWFK